VFPLIFNRYKISVNVNIRLKEIRKYANISSKIQKAVVLLEPHTTTHTHTHALDKIKLKKKTEPYKTKENILLKEGH
jgi:hypothetical protein